MRTLTITLILFALASGFAQAGDFLATRKAGDYEVSLALAGDSLVVGQNTATVAIKGPAGQHLSGLPVEIYYFMPSMPAMNTTVKAAPEGSSYTGSIEPSMGGAWEVEVRFQAPDGKKYHAAFTFEIK